MSIRVADIENENYILYLLGENGLVLGGGGGEKVDAVGDGGGGRCWLSVI